MLLALVIVAVVLVRRRAGKTIDMNTEYGAQEDYEDEDTNVTDNNDMYKTGEYADYADYQD